jgi:transposase
MVVVGVDVHKHNHFAQAVDVVGRALTGRGVAATDAGNAELVAWARQEFADVEVLFAVEDCRRMATRLERALLAAGYRVVRVPPKLMAGARAGSRTRGKSDPIDALAIARVALREPDLPVAAHDDASREMKLLVDHRDSLVHARTAAQNRLRWHLHELDPELAMPTRGLDGLRVMDWLAEWLEEQPAGMVVRLAAELVADIRVLSVRIKQLDKELAERVAVSAPQLLELTGCGVLTAAKLVAETANASRFRSEACFAMQAGVAPIPASSGRTERHRLARGGNRQLNVALHRIALTQARLPGPGQVYYQRRRAAGNTSKEALRALKRRLARVVFNLLKSPPAQASGPALPAAA